MASLVRASMIFLLAATVASASPQSEPNRNLRQISQGQIKVDVDLTLVNATVIDRQGHNVAGLSVKNFKVWESKIEQNIEYFSAEDIPVSLGLILDVSGSMRTATSVAHDAAVTFIKEGNHDDEYFLIEFNEGPAVTAINLKTVLFVLGRTARRRYMTRYT